MSVTDWVTVGIAVFAGLLGLIVKLSNDKIEANKKSSDDVIAANKKISDDKSADFQKNLDAALTLVRDLEKSLHAQQVEFLKVLADRRSERAAEYNILHAKLEAIVKDENLRQEKLMQLLGDMRETAAGFQGIYVTRHELFERGLLAINSAAVQRLPEKGGG